MTHEEIKNNLIQALGALNNIAVHGKTNLANLVGCISVLETIIGNMEEEQADE